MCTPSPCSTLFPYTTLFRSLVLAANDPAGRLWITQLAGPAGFLNAPDEHTLTVAARPAAADPLAGAFTRSAEVGTIDRKSTRLNSSHVEISYAVFCLKKKNR